MSRKEKGPAHGRATGPEKTSNFRTHSTQNRDRTQLRCDRSILENLEIAVVPQWVEWLEEIRDGNETKPPIDPKTGMNASVIDPKTWGTFDEAWGAYVKYGYDGVGYVFTENDGVTGLDFDECRDPDSGTLDPEVEAAVKQLNSYTEVSPSGRGVHVLVFGKLPPGPRRKGKVEMYDTGRYFTMTGWHMEGTPLTLQKRDAELKTLHDHFFSHARHKSSHPNNHHRTQKNAQTHYEELPDEEILRKARGAKNGDKFMKLWAGDWSDYPSHSEGDLALCAILSYWTDRNTEQIDRLFRRSGLCRPKWDERRFADGRSYGEATIEKALEPGCEEAHSDEPGPGGDENCGRDEGAQADADCFEKWSDPKTGRYFVEHGQVFKYVTKRDGSDEVVPVANFAVRVVEDIIQDDGAEEKRFVAVEGRMPDGDRLRILPRKVVPITQFDSMGWISTAWGPEPTAYPRQKDYLAFAIRRFSGSVPQRVICAHLGWRRLNGEMVFCHAGGVIGAKGVEVDVKGDGLTRYILPDAPGDVLGAMRTSLQFLDIGDPQVAYPTWGLIWRAPLCEILPCNVMTNLIGGSGLFKSSHIAALMGHGGNFQTKEDLPARWEFTDNILEKGTFLAKDMVYVIDDFNPETTRVRKDELERRFARLAGDVGNLTARRRMRRDMGTRLEYMPRGVVVSTGEYVPNIATSRLARIFTIPYRKGAVDKDKLTMLQAQLPVLPHAMYGFINYIRQNFQFFVTRTKDRFDYIRKHATDLTEYHSRLPENFAHLYLGLEEGIYFAVYVGALEQKVAKDHLGIGWNVFKKLAREQGHLIQEERPTVVFLDTIAEAIAAGRAWLADRLSGALKFGDNMNGGEKLGWVDNNGIYLIPGVAYRFATCRLSHRGGVPLSEKALHRMLFEEGNLLKTSAEPDRLVPKIRCEKSPLRVLWLKRTALGELPLPIHMNG